MTIERLKQLIGDLVITQTELIEQLSAERQSKDVLLKELADKNAIIELLKQQENN